MYALYLDESVCEQQDCQWPNCRGFLVVGGYLFNLADSNGVEDAWRSTKGSLGLLPEYPLKWAPDNQDSAVTRQLHLTMTTLRRSCVQSVSTMPVTAYACTMLDVRREAVTTPSDPRILYPEAMKYILQRVIPSVPQDEQLVVVINRPASQRRSSCQTPGRNAVILRYADAGSDNPFSAFQDYRLNGNTNGLFPRFSFAPLRQATCPLSLLMGVTRYDNFLQIADVIVGAFRQWVSLELTPQPASSPCSSHHAFARRCASALWPLLDRAGGGVDTDACSQGFIVFGDPLHKNLAETLCIRRMNGPTAWEDEVPDNDLFS